VALVQLEVGVYGTIRHRDKKSCRKCLCVLFAGIVDQNEKSLLLKCILGFSVISFGLFF
jgi:hypothetical protein